MVESIGASGPAGFEKIIKYTAMIVSILTLVIGVITFFVQQSNQADTRERESRATFLAKQLDVYAVAVQTVSELSLDPNIDKDEEKYKQNLRIFSQLYYGQMAMVEGPDVAEVMEAIKKLLNDEIGKTREECLESMRNLSLTLAHCVRRSLGKGWGVDFDSDQCTEDKLESLQTTCLRPVRD